MQNFDRIKDKEINVLASQISLGVETNTLLRTILDVLVETHLDGKPEEEQKKFEEFVNRQLSKNRDLAVNSLSLVKK